MASPIGTPVEITWAAGATPAAQNVTPPVGCNCVVMFWTGYMTGTGDGLAAVTLNGNAPFATLEVPDGASFAPATGVAIWFNPATGSPIALDVDWDAAPFEGPTTFVVFVENADVAGWRDADAARIAGTTQQTITLTTVSGDLVLALDQRYNALPANESGYTDYLTGDNNNEFGRVRYLVADAASESASTQDTNDSSIVAVSIPDLPAGGGANAVAWLVA